MPPVPPPSTAASRLSKKASVLHKQVSRLSSSTVDRMFPTEQRAQWPTGYVPASGVAHFLRPGGVPFQDLLDCAEDLRSTGQQQQQGQRELQRDFASDYTLWSRCVLEDALKGLDERQKRSFKKITARDRGGGGVRDAGMREFFDLTPFAPAAPASMGAPPDPTKSIHLKHGPMKDRGGGSGGGIPPPPAKATTAAAAVKGLRLSPQERDKYYEFTPYAATQAYAMMPVAGIEAAGRPVSFTSYPQVRNVLYRDFDSMSPLRALSLFSGDDLVYTTEMVQTIALHLKRRLHELLEGEAAFTRAAAAPSDIDIGFSRETPILCCFGNGRLSWCLNQTGLLPVQGVRPMQLPSQAGPRARRHEYLSSRQKQNFLFNSYDFSESFTHLFPCETISVGDALRKYQPAIVIVEPHVDRDWLAAIRGFYSVREVMVMGPIDSAAMCSFAFPFLSFGVTPGPTTYWVYNNNLQRVAASDRIQLPVDPPHELQGYERVYNDDVSARLISPNDCPAIGRQYRCLSFVRRECPVVRSKSSKGGGGSSHGSGTAGAGPTVTGKRETPTGSPSPPPPVTQEWRK